MTEPTKKEKFFANHPKLANFLKQTFPDILDKVDDFIPGAKFLTAIFKHEPVS